MITLGKEYFWLTLASPRYASIDWLHPNVFLKGLASKIPRRFWPEPGPKGTIIGIREDAKGTAPVKAEVVMRVSSEEHVKGLTSATEVGRRLYLGTVQGELMLEF